MSNTVKKNQWRKDETENVDGAPDSLSKNKDFYRATKAEVTAEAKEALADLGQKPKTLSL